MDIVVIAPAVRAGRRVLEQVRGVASPVVRSGEDPLHAQLREQLRLERGLGRQCARRDQHIARRKLPDQLPARGRRLPLQVAVGQHVGTTRHDDGCRDEQGISIQQP